MLAEVIEETMVAADYSPPAMSAANRHDLRLLLRRLALKRARRAAHPGAFPPHSVAPAA